LAIENVRKLNLCGRLKEETAGNQRKNKSDSHPSVISHSHPAGRIGARRQPDHGGTAGRRDWSTARPPIMVSFAGPGRTAGGSVSYVAAAEPEHEGPMPSSITVVGRICTHACLLAVAACICMNRGRTCAHARPALLCTASSSPLYSTRADL
jgi:hypothetical protein